MPLNTYAALRTVTVARPGYIITAAKTAVPFLLEDTISGGELAEAYSSLDSTRYYAEIEKENREKMAAAICDLDRLISKDDKVIDIGTGNGLFVTLLRSSARGGVH